MPTAAQPKKQDRTPKPGHKVVTTLNVPVAVIEVLNAAAKERGQEPAEYRRRLFAAAPTIERYMDLTTACQELLDYRRRNTHNFQLEKADDFLARIAAAVQPDPTPAEARLRVAERADAAARADAGKVTP